MLKQKRRDRLCRLAEHAYDASGVPLYSAADLKWAHFKSAAVQNQLPLVRLNSEQYEIRLGSHGMKSVKVRCSELLLNWLQAVSMPFPCRPCMLKPVQKTFVACSSASAFAGSGSASCVYVCHSKEALSPSEVLVVGYANLPFVEYTC